MIQKNPIFYDQSLRRWKITKIFLYFMLAIVGSGILGIILGALIKPALPANASETPQKNNLAMTLRNWYPTEADLATQVYQKQYLPKIENLDSNRPREIYAFYQLSDYNSIQSLKVNGENIDKVIIDAIYLKDVQGRIYEENTYGKNELKKVIKDEKLKIEIIPTVSNYEKKGFSSEKISEVFLDASTRKNNINEISNYLKENNFKAINVSYFDISPSLQTPFKKYLKELASRLGQEGIITYVTLPADDNNYDYKGIAQAVDFVVLTGYDQTIATDNAGPVAAQAWLKQVYARRTAQIPPSKIILGLANTGYNWTSGKAKAVSFQEAMNLASTNKAVFSYDQNALNPHFAYTDEAGQAHNVWFLDATTLFNGLMAGEANAPKGYVLWYLGSEDPAIWNFFNRNINLKKASESLKNIPASGGAVYIGETGITRISKKPETGLREYTLNGGLVANEKYVKYPSSYVIETKNFIDNKKIVLTFDDGPDKIYTPQIMEVLKNYNVTATFFVIGSSANSNPDITQQIATNFEIGNHTYTHPNIGKIQPKTLEFELNATQRVIENLTGHRTILFRSPYAFDADPVYPRDLTALDTLSDLGYYNVPIGADSLDWQKSDAQVLADRVINSVEKDNNHIILFHDGGGDRSHTVKALPLIIEALQKKGYEFTTIGAASGLSQEIVMPKTSGTVFSTINSFGYNLINWFNVAIWVIFFVGIILGAIRFTMLTTFAATGWFKLRQKFSDEFHPKVSAVISAFNEAKVIKRTVNALLTSRYYDLEIIIINDGSSDNTLEILEKYFSQNPKIKILSHANMGKAASLNRGIKMAKGSIIITLDADTLIKPEAIPLLVRHFDDPRVGAVAGNAKVGNRINMLTKLQAIEYITSQSHDRRAFGIVNSITVVPGAIGAWRKSAILKSGGFSYDTLAEDADLTVEILKRNYIIETEQNALGYTEAPDNIKSFLKQRFRWIYGTLQVGWKNRKIMFQPKYGLVAFFGIPNILFFQLFFSILAPIVDLMIILTIMISFWHFSQHPAEFSWTNVTPFFIYYAIFSILDASTAVLAFLMEKREDKSLLLWLPMQRIFYRQLINYVTWKAIYIAVKGKFVSWEKIIRKNTVQVSITRAQSKAY